MEVSYSHTQIHIHYSEELPGAHLVCPSLSVAMETIQSPPLSDLIESVFILGGSSVYEVSVYHTVVNITVCAMKPKVPCVPHQLC